MCGDRNENTAYEVPTLTPGYFDTVKVLLRGFWFSRLSRFKSSCDTVYCCGREPLFQRTQLLEDGGSKALRNIDILPQH